MSIIVNRNITFIDSNEFYKCSLDTLASNLEDKDFKYLMAEFNPDKLETLKRKDAYPYECILSKGFFFHLIKRIKVIDIFLMSNIYTYKILGIHLI